jgi:hypothetical protein
LPGNIAPGGSVTNLSINVAVPATPGTYCLIYDLVKEGVTWFGNQGGTTSPLTVTVAPAGGGGGPTVAYLETWDGDPSSPQSAYMMEGWDTQVEQRDPGAWYEPIPMNAAHGPDCSAPPATHSVTTFEGHVYQCRNHVMTSVDGAAGYGLVALTPNAIIDFSDGPATLRFDVSTLRGSSRDWWDVWITPYDGNVTEPIHWYIASQGHPANSVQIRMLSGQRGTFFDAQIHTGTVGCEFCADDGAYQTDKGYEEVLVPDGARRDTFELVISTDHLKFSMPNYDMVWFDQDINPLPFDQGIVQLVHHSYTPDKGYDMHGAGNGPATYHWDNISIDKAIPFTMIHGDKRYVDEDNQSVTFDSPAPANSHLRFSARGNVEVSFNGGSTWQQAQHQPVFITEGWTSFFTPIPAGTQEVKFRFTPRDWYYGPYMARDFAIWSLDGSQQVLSDNFYSEGWTPISVSTQAAYGFDCEAPGASGPATMFASVDAFVSREERFG